MGTASDGGSVIVQIALKAKNNSIHRYLSAEFGLVFLFQADLNNDRSSLNPEYVHPPQRRVHPPQHRVPSRHQFLAAILEVQLLYQRLVPSRAQPSMSADRRLPLAPGQPRRISQKENRDVSPIPCSKRSRQCLVDCMIGTE